MPSGWHLRIFREKEIFTSSVPASFFLNDLLNSKLYYQLHGLGLVFCWNMLDVILCYCLILQVYYILSIYYFVMIVGVLLLDRSQFCNYNSIYLYRLSHISLLTTVMVRIYKYTVKCWWETHFGVKRKRCFWKYNNSK